MRTRRTTSKHCKEDFDAIKVQLSSYEENSLRLFRCTIIPTLYEENLSANIPLYEDSPISLLEYIFLEYCKFVIHPFYAKSTVSETFRTDSNFKLPKPNLCPQDFSQVKKIIKDFLVPLQTFNVCPKDCIVFRKDYEKLEKCVICNSAGYKKMKAT